MAFRKKFSVLESNDLNYEEALPSVEIANLASQKPLDHGLSENVDGVHIRGAIFDLLGFSPQSVSC